MRPDGWTVILWTNRWKVIGVWHDVTGTTADEAIDKTVRNHVPKAERLHACRAVAYPQDVGFSRHVRPVVDYELEAWEEAPA